MPQLKSHEKALMILGARYAAGFAVGTDAYVRIELFIEAMKDMK